ncbi:J domain-containing protein [Natrinema salsiterrestre]|uniref:J domain-containing protein n=1 Tax=Natrinema salsiterrestre TaxID=2950540 RepID=A0A9Q4L414_9EURY|nr:J domain-containing protein [Natrinema salsiterrestre]MDF9746914.1 J domain-containing protein [Natrinema salsiterrestre]
MTEDFYDLLEIPPDASQDEIKDAYRDQVRVYHPDLNDDDRAQAQFTAVKTAYDILGDPVERQAYDRLGHEDYVAKRTSGLPSPDVWQSDDDASATAATPAAASTASGSTTAGRSSSATGSNGSKAAAGAASASAGTAGGASSATGTGTGTGQTGGSGSASTSRTGSTSGATTSSTGRSRTTSSAGPDNAVARWWRRQNFSLPLLWLSVLAYAAGLGQFGHENRGPLESLWADLRAVGADPAGIWTLLSESRHGLETMTAFFRGVEIVAPPVEPTLWYGALAGVVAVAVGALLVVRVVSREHSWGPVTIDETIVVALAVGVTATLVGGPLLAGALLMPLLFGVVVRHTRRGPGWKPSYLYVFPVFAPLAGVGLSAASYGTVPVDLVAFVLLPIGGGVALPLRATLKKHVGR